MKKIGKISLLAIVTGSLLLGSCKKDKENDTDITAAEDQSTGEMSFDQVFKQVDESAQDLGLKKGGYPIVTIDSNSNPKTMTIFYGSSNYLCKDGNYRRGSILVNWTGKYRDAGTIINIGFDKFYQNDNQLEGTKAITNMGRNATDQLSFAVVVNGKVTTSEGKSITWNSNRTRTWLSGEGTLIASDDVYEVSGSTNGVNRNGVSFSANISKNLRVDLGCEWRIVSGVIDITPEGKLVRSLDFGNGACDRLVTVTVNGKSKTFERRK